jgi:hypothetical protein
MLIAVHDSRYLCVQVRGCTYRQEDDKEETLKVEQGRHFYSLLRRKVLLYEDGEVEDVSRNLRRNLSGFSFNFADIITGKSPSHKRGLSDCSRPKNLTFDP